MKAKRHLTGKLAAVFAAATLTLFSGQPAESATADDAKLTIHGAGATFPQPLYQRWIQEYEKTHPETRFTYAGLGSGAGVQGFLAGSIDFGASDAAMNDAELARVDPERGVVMLPMTAGMVVLAYNIPDVPTGLRLPRDVYLDLFAGRIRDWDHPRIRDANPDLDLPHKAVVTVVRRDSSGTTFAFTNHLAAVDPDWADKGPGVGKLVDWPGIAMAVPGNEGVAQRVKITDGAIGFMAYEFAQRLGLPVATLQNKSGTFVAPGPRTGQAALASVTDIPADLRIYLPDPEGADAYPIVSYTWLLLSQRYADPAVAGALKGAITWGLDQGQPIAEEMGYIPLPEVMIGKAKEALARVR
ncbi:phosphate ABC transporter substrate-binding protein PstS [Thiocystis violacea]|uniref:phosphate ABC transporter substrate-binding protein PstS n=1 Tax=Thiocystis violacea TaxID=13725 RepID=UPI0019041833|nr:phosphate ABC transporter substrate-binding protein PstS [Thiocystis violacea]MBK1724109.1 phosphate ABC transporter substrate-binding protein PstS [Thiocystis violacea]